MILLTRRWLQCGPRHGSLTGSLLRVPQLRAGPFGRTPRPREGETMILLDDLSNRLGFPLSPLMMGVLDHYGVQLVHLTLSFLTFLACFVHLCEAFLELRPELDVFRHFFKLHKLDGDDVPCGCSLFALHDAPGIFLNAHVQGRDDARRWWFITSSDVSLPPSRNVAAAPSPSWRAPPSYSDPVLYQARPAFISWWRTSFVIG